MERCCKKCGFDLNSFNPSKNPYAFCPAGPCNPVEMKIGETCEEFDSQDTDGSHTNHASKMCFEDTYFNLGWGHLEARLQSCLVQVTI